MVSTASARSAMERGSAFGEREVDPGDDGKRGSGGQRRREPEGACRVASSAGRWVAAMGPSVIRRGRSPAKTSRNTSALMSTSQTQQQQSGRWSRIRTDRRVVRGGEHAAGELVRQVVGGLTSSRREGVEVHEGLDARVARRGVRHHHAAIGVADEDDRSRRWCRGRCGRTPHRSAACAAGWAGRSCDGRWRGAGGSPRRTRRRRRTTRGGERSWGGTWRAWRAPSTAGERDRVGSRFG